MSAVVGSRLALRVDAEADVVLSLAAARGWVRRERLRIETAEGRELSVDELDDAHGTRLHRARLPEGRVTVSYEAEVSAPDRAEPSSRLDVVRYLRPSRYVPSDELTAVAAADIGPGSGSGLVHRIADWVAGHLSYVSGSSGPTDTAVHTLLQRRGVCRDYAHLTAGLLRARGVPARLVSVYAPGLSPMDFHAVVEAFVDDRWEVVDATRLAPRPQLVRIATGRDAADTAFLTTLSGAVALDDVAVTAIAQPQLAVDDHTGSVVLS